MTSYAIMGAPQMIRYVRSQIALAQENRVSPGGTRVHFPKPATDILYI